jgi:hypothetical protein
MRWAEGELRAADHPDAEGELVLAALGGEATPCLDLVRAWGQHSDDLRALAIGPRSAADKLTITPAALEGISAAHSGRGWASYSSSTSWSGRAHGLHMQALVASGATVRRAARASARARVVPTPLASARARVVPTPRASALGWAHPIPGVGPAASLVRGWATGGSWPGWPGADEDPAPAELIWLLSLGPPFQFRLCGAVAHAWSENGKHASRRGQAGPALTAALTGRLAPAVAQWLGIDPDQVEVSLHDEGGWGSMELSRSAGERRLYAKLPVSWLAAVWAPGLAVVDSYLVVSVEHAAWPAADVLALPAPGRPAVELTLRHDKQGWLVAA